VQLIAVRAIVCASMCAVEARLCAVEARLCAVYFDWLVHYQIARLWDENLRTMTMFVACP
jgi:hypothetical protein